MVFAALLILLFSTAATVQSRLLHLATTDDVVNFYADHEFAVVGFFRYSFANRTTTLTNLYDALFHSVAAKMLGFIGVGQANKKKT
jgi:hypothetical protein